MSLGVTSSTQMTRKCIPPVEPARTRAGFAGSAGANGQRSVGGAVAVLMSDSGSPGASGFDSSNGGGSGPIAPGRSPANHPAVFPEELASRMVLLATSAKACGSCGKLWKPTRSGPGQAPVWSSDCKCGETVTRASVLDSRRQRHERSRGRSSRPELPRRQVERGLRLGSTRQADRHGRLTWPQAVGSRQWRQPRSRPAYEAASGVGFSPPCGRGQ